jgi:hypothetical protein
MRITGFGNIKPTDSKKKKKSTDSSSGSEFASMVSDAKENSPASGAGAVSISQAVLGVQEVDWNEQSKKEQMQRGNQLLDLLEAIRDGILLGKVSPQDLHKLQQTLAAKKDSVDDPKLATIVQEIEVRAAVELAKLEKFHY